MVTHFATWIKLLNCWSSRSRSSTSNRLYSFDRYLQPIAILATGALIALSAVGVGASFRHRLAA
jgi:hypothetical protein